MTQPSGTLFEYMNETAHTLADDGEIPGCDHTLRFTGQWADLPLETLAQKVSGWGFDGLELACAGIALTNPADAGDGAVPGQYARHVGTGADLDTAFDQLDVHGAQDVAAPLGAQVADRIMLQAHPGVGRPAAHLFDPVQVADRLLRRQVGGRADGNPGVRRRRRG